MRKISFQDTIRSSKRLRNKKKGCQLKYKKVYELKEMCIKSNIQFTMPTKNGKGVKMRRKKDLIQDIKNAK